jgi:chromosome segregation ATPase
MTAAANLAIVGDRPATHLSPARQALAAASASIGELKAAVARASRPAERLRQQTRAANEQVAAAEAELAAIDAQHAAAIRDAAKNDTAIELATPPAREKAEAAVERARRTRDAVARAVPECEQEVQRANLALQKAEAELDPLLLGVLLAEHGTTVQRWHEARAAFVAAEAELLGLQHAIAQRGRDLEARAPGRGVAWLREWERLRGLWQKEPLREAAGGDIQAASARWSALLARLRGDPSAAL